MNSNRLPLALAFLLLLAGAPMARAQFTVTSPNTVGAQTLNNATGTINAGGTISTTGSAVGVAITGTSTLNNNGTIITTSGRSIDSNSGTATLTVTNTGLIQSTSADAFRVNTNSAVSLTNSGTIRVTAGGQAIDWAAITSQSNVLTNQLGGLISAVGEDAVRLGTSGVVINAGTISATPTGTTSPSGSDGIDLRTFTGISVTNTGTISGRHGIATDGANVGPSTLSVNNNAGTIFALNGSGLNVDGANASVTANVTNAFGATIRGGVLAASTNGDGDGIDVDGVVTLNNSGNIFALGAKGTGSDGGANNAEALAIGGGNITNTATGQIVGSTLAADAPNGDITRLGSGILVDNSSGGNAVAATIVNNSGLIRGKTGFGVKIVGTFADTITNNAGGIIRGTGSNAVVQTGDGADTVNNAGTVQHDGSLIAIALEAGNDTLNVTGGSTAIVGGIDGGIGTNTMNVLAGAGNTFAFAHAITNFNSVIVKSGTFDLGGTATVNAAITVESGGILAGTGAALHSVTLQSGGVIAAGHSPGTLAITGDLNLLGGSAFNFELGANQAGSDLVTVGGALNFTGPGLVSFNFADLGLLPGTYDLIRFSGLSGLTLANLAFGTTPLGFAGNFVIDADSVSLNVTPIPEPSTYALLIGLGAFAVVALRRRRNGA